MKTISLTQGFVTQVDDKNYDWLNQWKWCVSKDKNNFYAVRKEHGKYIAMHRVIMNTPDGMQTDHQDRNGLNNQEYNLKNCTKSQNAKNKKAVGSSKYLGVSIENYNYKKKNGYTYKTSRKLPKYVVHIKYEGKNHYVGRFNSETEAAKAYDKEAILHHGEFANLNFK
jgi:hypothetical protein